MVLERIQATHVAVSLLHRFVEQDIFRLWRGRTGWGVPHTSGSTMVPLELSFYVGHLDYRPLRS